VLFGLLGVAAPVGAEAGAALDASLLDDVRALALGKAAESGGSRVEVTIGQLDPRLHLAPCQNIEPYLPPGVRLWGKARIGLRCKTGPTPWNVYLPVTVKVFGRALVVPAGAAAGSVLAEADLAEAEVDLAEEFTPALVDPRLAVGRTLAQNLRPGQTLRQTHIKSRQWFVAGETVRVIATRRGLRARERGAGAQQRHRRPAGSECAPKAGVSSPACPPASGGSRWRCETIPHSRGRAHVARFENS
jgi:flagella basal body P-ring formation protein FlgA